VLPHTSTRARAPLARPRTRTRTRTHARRHGRVVILVRVASAHESGVDDSFGRSPSARRARVKLEYLARERVSRALGGTGDDGGTVDAWTRRARVA
jgi:hypothetical protein